MMNSIALLKPNQNFDSVVARVGAEVELAAAAATEAAGGAAAVPLELLVNEEGSKDDAEQ